MEIVLKESAYPQQNEYLDFAVENERQTFVFVTQPDLQWAVDNQGLEDVTDQVPTTRQAIDSRIEDGEVWCEVTLTRTERGLIRSKEVETTNVFDIKQVRMAMGCLPDGVDAIAEGTVYMKPAETAPLMIEFPRSPEKLVELREAYRPEGPVDSTAPTTDDPCGCMVPASKSK